MESQLHFEIIGNYSIEQVDWKFSEDRPKHDCCICNNARWGSIVVEINPDGKYICVECLLESWEKHNPATK